MIIPLTIWNSINKGTFIGVFITLMSRAMENHHHDYPEGTSDLQTHNKSALYALVVRGLGDIIGANMIGITRDRFGNKCAIAM